MIYALIKGISLNNESQSMIFIVDRVDSDKTTSGTVQYSIAIGDLKIPKLVRLKLQKAIVDEINTNFNKTYALNDVFFVSFSNDSSLSDWQPINTFVVEEPDSKSRLSKKTWYRNCEEGEYSGRVCEELYTYSSNSLVQKETRYYDSDATTVISTEIDKYYTTSTGRNKILKKEYQ